MAKVQAVDLTISPVAGNDKQAEITVSYRLAFTQAEAGKSYRVGINLFSDDKKEDDHPTGVVSQLLYSFIFGDPASKKNYQTLIAQTGEHVFSETRKVDTAILDEDPGMEDVWVPGKKYPYIPGHYITVPMQDEIYAAVQLARGLVLEGAGRSEILKNRFWP